MTTDEKMKYVRDMLIEIDLLVFESLVNEVASKDLSSLELIKLAIESIEKFAQKGDIL